MKLNVLLSTCIVLAVIITNAVDGQVDLNCFLNDFEAKEADIPIYQNFVRPTSIPVVNLTIDYNDTLSKVSKYIFGNAVAVWVNPNVNNPLLVSYLKKLSPTLIRFPGGSWSDVYFWNGNPGDLPVTIPNSSGSPVALGPQMGPGHVPTFDSYLDMRDQIGSQGLITVNYAYARYGLGDKPAERAAHLAADWVRHDNGKTKYWEIGNESAGPWEAGWRIDPTKNKDGQPEIITGHIYSEHFKIYVDSMKKAAAETGAEIFIGAQIIQYDGTNDGNVPNRLWNKAVFEEIGDTADFYVIHNYFGGNSSTPQSYLNTALTSIRDMHSFIRQDITNKGGTQLPIALTEWNMNDDGGNVKTSFINGMQGVLAMSEMAKLGYGMSCRWLVANWNTDGMFYHKTDQIVIPEWNPRPDFYYLYYLQKYFGSHFLGSTITGSSNVLAYTTLFKSGKVGIVLVNIGNEDLTIAVNLENKGYGSRFYYYSLTGGKEDPNFSKNVFVNGVGPEAKRWGPLANLDSIEAYSDTLSHPVKIISPRLSVQYILLETGSGTIEQVEVDSFFVSAQNDITDITEDNGSIQLLGNFLPENTTNNEVVWSLSDSSVAKVNAFGLLTALSNGNVTAYGTSMDGERTDSVTITISNQRFEVTGISLVSETVQRRIKTPGGTLKILTKIIPDNADDKRVTWELNDTNLASINEDGVITAKLNGRLEVTCHTVDGDNIATIVITISGQTSGINNSTLDGLKIYPIPAKNTLFIENDEQILYYEILNIEGRVLKTITNPDLKTEIDISDLNQGIYLLRAQTGSDFAVRRFIK